MVEMSKKILLTASVLGALGVIFGAFGAHGLDALLTENQRHDTFDTAVRYHFYHVFALLAAGIIHQCCPLPGIRLCYYLFVSGLMIFSGSLYALSLTNISLLGAITPIGGVLLITGWITIALGIRKLA